jgi:hypothetical protein
MQRVHRSDDVVHVAFDASKNTLGQGSSILVRRRRQSSGCSTTRVDPPLREEIPRTRKTPHLNADRKGALGAGEGASLA